MSLTVTFMSHVFLSCSKTGSHHIFGSVSFLRSISTPWASLVAQTVKPLPAMHEIQVGKIPWRRAWQPTPVCLPGEFQGQKSLADYSPWGCRESDMTERLNFPFNALGGGPSSLGRPSMVGLAEAGVYLSRWAPSCSSGAWRH